MVIPQFLFFKSGRPDASKAKTCSAAETNMNVRPSSAVTDKRKSVSRSKCHRRRENHNKHLSKGPQLISFHLVLDVQLPTHLSALSPRHSLHSATY